LLSDRLLAWRQPRSVPPPRNPRRAQPHALAAPVVRPAGAREAPPAPRPPALPSGRHEALGPSARAVHPRRAPRPRRAAAEDAAPVLPLPVPRRDCGADDRAPAVVQGLVSFLLLLVLASSTFKGRVVSAGGDGLPDAHVFPLPAVPHDAVQSAST